jgi:hypothetical protein
MPPAKRRRRTGTKANKRLDLQKRLVQIRTEIAKLKRDRATVRREEFVEVTASLRQLQENTDGLIKHTRDLATQLTRISQIQAEVDGIKRILAKARLTD